MSEPRTLMGFFDDPDPAAAVASSEPAPAGAAGAVPSSAIAAQPNPAASPFGQPAQVAGLRQPVPAVSRTSTGHTSPTATEETKRERSRAKPATVSTWIVGIPAIFILMLAPSNPALGAITIGAIAALTGIYALATGRPSWARVKSRSAAVAPLLLGLALVASSVILPTSLVVAPKFLTAPPSPNADQFNALTVGLEAIDPRFTMDWADETIVAKSVDVCVNDFSAQTPDQEIKGIREHLTFQGGTQMTAIQAHQYLDVVRSSFCGYPGDRDETVKSELSYSLQGIAWILTQFVGSFTAPAPTPAPAASSQGQ